MRRVAVFCGSSSGYSEAIAKLGYDLGIYLASHDLELVYGGSRLGLMGQIAKGVLDNNGKVIGVIPDFLKTKEIVHPSITELVVTTNMHDRKVMMYEKSDAFLIIPGGFGTMDEFFEIATWGQLGLHAKPIAILNCNGYYDHLIAQCEVMVGTGFLKSTDLERLIVGNSIEEVFDQISRFVPQPAPQWLNIDRV